MLWFIASLLICRKMHETQEDKNVKAISVAWWFYQRKISIKNWSKISYLYLIYTNWDRKSGYKSIFEVKNNDYID